MPVYLPEAQQTCSGERTVNQCLARALIVGILAIPVTAGVIPRQSQADEPMEVRYLAFQVCTGASDPTIAMGGSGSQPLGPIPAQSQLDAFVQDVIQRIGMVGEGPSQLAVIFGPLAFDH